MCEVGGSICVFREQRSTQVNIALGPTGRGVATIFCDYIAGETVNIIGIDTANGLTDTVGL